jgi:hypothetical protein
VDDQSADPRAWVSTEVDLHGTRKLGLRMISRLRSLRILCVLCDEEGAATRPRIINHLRGSYRREPGATHRKIARADATPILG